MSRGRLRQIFLALFLAMFITGAARAGGLAVHEWGTFTSFQDENGKAFSHINTDDEPVPPFVHELGNPLIFRPTEYPPLRSQGARAGHPDVTMRLETPVIYFHPAPGRTLELDVSVAFAGGWLTQYYPMAQAGVAGLDAEQPNGEGIVKVDGASFDMGRLSESTVGRLVWKGLKVGVDASGPETSDRVWTAPRAVKAATVSAGREAEQFLFYRGVGHLDAPLRISRQTTSTAGAEELRFTLASSSEMPRFTGGWLVDVRPNGATAYRVVAAEASSTPAEFAPDDYASGNLAKLRAEMHAALVKDGLFADEADALLNTWELSYFKSPGLRFFFLVPRAWTDRVLPLTLSVKANIVRTMVGRIELVTPRQRELVRKMAKAGPLPPLQDVLAAMRKLQTDPARAADYAALASGRGDPAVLGLPVPDVYRHYLELGRFRTALILDQQKEFNGKQAELLQQFWLAHVAGQPAPAAAARPR